MSSIPFRQAAYLQPLKDFSLKDKAEPRGPWSLLEDDTTVHTWLISV